MATLCAVKLAGVYNLGGSQVSRSARARLNPQIHSRKKVAEQEATAPHVEIHSVTFGCPRVGNAKFRRSYKASVPATRRWVLAADPVTRVPSMLCCFRHVIGHHSIDHHGRSCCHVCCDILRTPSGWELGDEGRGDARAGRLTCSPPPLFSLRRRPCDEPVS